MVVDGAVREVYARVLGRGLKLLSANGGRFERNQLLFADDTALVADSKEKLCRQKNEFGRYAKERSCNECGYEQSYEVLKTC